MHPGLSWIPDDLGRIIDPESGRGYRARLRLRGDVLEVGGCILMICRDAGAWQRVR